MEVATNKVFLVIGKSFSGKDTLIKNILDNDDFVDKYNIKRLVRYTTRQMRENEVEGDNYYFISDEEYENTIWNKDTTVITSFNSRGGRVHYITDFSDMEENTNYILDGDQDMVQPFREKLGNRLCVIYLIPPNWEIFRRFNNRKEEDEDKKYKEIYRRFSSELIQYDSKAKNFLNGTNCIIVLGKEPSTSIIIGEMIAFIKGTYFSLGIILAPKKKMLFDNKFEDMNENTVVRDLFDFISINAINIKSGIVVYPESESFLEIEEKTYRSNKTLAIYNYNI